MSDVISKHIPCAEETESIFGERRKELILQAAKDHTDAEVKQSYSSFVNNQSKIE